MAKAYIFDFGNVISALEPAIFGRAVLPYAGCTPDELRDRVVGTGDVMLAYESGAMDSGTFLQVFRERLGVSAMPVDEFIKAWAGFFTPIPYTRGLIRLLKPVRTVALLSNTNPLHFEHVIRPADVFPLFDAVTLSYEAGVMKPAPAIFKDMLGKLQLPPGECVYVDDLAENVEAAAATGMQALHFTTPAEFHPRLLALEADPEVAALLKNYQSHISA